jgi:ribosomal protein S18 acetylase RimI-like enzyme
MFSATPTTSALPPRARDPRGVRSRSSPRDATRRDSARRTTRRARGTHSGLNPTGHRASLRDDAGVPEDDDAPFAAEDAAREAEDEPAIFVSGVSLRDDALRACASLRVKCFYRYDGNDENGGALLFGEAAQEAKRTWLKRRLKAETDRGRRLTDLGMRVATFAATRRAPDDATLEKERDALKAAEKAEAKRWDLNAMGPERREVSERDDAAIDDGQSHAASVTASVPARCLISPPNGGANKGAKATEVVGTVDLHVGARLPGEFLEGTLPRRVDGGNDVSPDAGEPDAVRVVGEGGPTPSSPGTTRSREGGVAVAVAAAAAFAATAAADDALVAASSMAAAFDLPLSPPEDGGEGYAGGGALDGRRAYVFNVCVAPHARRRGVARRLLVAAHASAARGGVEYVYCHVERANVAARGLYESLGYVPEAEESDWLAGKLGRPPRVLMRKSLTS